MDFLRSNFLRNETLLSWTFPVIKIRFSSNQNIGAGESNFDDKYVEKSVQLVRGSFFRNDLLQNPYFDSLLMFQQTVVFRQQNFMANRTIGILRLVISWSPTNPGEIIFPNWAIAAPSCGQKGFGGGELTSWQGFTSLSGFMFDLKKFDKKKLCMYVYGFQIISVEINGTL